MLRSILSGADGVVSRRSRSPLIDIREALLILFEITNHPVCAAKEWGLFINGAATSPLKGGEWGRLETRFNHDPASSRKNGKHTPKPLLRQACCGLCSWSCRNALMP